MKLLKKINKIEDKIQKLFNEIMILQASCPHENVEGVYESNTGNYDGYECYWIDCVCLDCKHRMFVDSKDNSLLYRKYSRSGMIKHK